MVEGGLDGYGPLSLRSWGLSASSPQHVSDSSAWYSSPSTDEWPGPQRTTAGLAQKAAAKLERACVGYIRPPTRRPADRSYCLSPWLPQNALPPHDWPPYPLPPLSLPHPT